MVDIKKEGEVTLYPSKEMRDWDKFAWEKGDVLRRESDKTMVLFEKFTDNTYTEFSGRYFLQRATIASDEIKILKTEDYSISTQLVREYIYTIEAQFNGKLNLKTLEVEKPKFKDGDIITTDAVPSLCYSKCIFILRGDLNANENSAYSYVFYNINNNYVDFNVYDTHIGARNIHFATVKEKTKLFNALAEKGKRWNAEKKIIEDVKLVSKKAHATYKKESDMPEHEFQPFERVLVRDSPKGVWGPALFGYKDIESKLTPYVCVSLHWTYCIPYEGNEHLLGTTKNPEEK